MAPAGPRVDVNREKLRPGDMDMLRGTYRGRPAGTKKSSGGKGAAPLRSRAVAPPHPLRRGQTITVGDYCVAI